MNESTKIISIISIILFVIYNTLGILIVRANLDTFVKLWHRIVAAVIIPVLSAIIAFFIMYGICKLIFLIF